MRQRKRSNSNKDYEIIYAFVKWGIAVLAPLVVTLYILETKANQTAVTGLVSTTAQ